MLRIKKALIGTCAFIIAFMAGKPTRLEAAPMQAPRPALLNQIQALVQTFHQQWPWLAYDTDPVMEALDQILEEAASKEDPISEESPSPSESSQEQNQNESNEVDEASGTQEADKTSEADEPIQAIDLGGLSNESKSWSWGYPDGGVAKYGGYYNKGGNRLFLTMDFGSDFGYTDAILDTLKEKGIKATLFLTTEYVQNHPHYVKRMAQDGHVLANHSTGHINMVKLLNRSPADLTANTRAWEGAVDDLLGYHTHLYRAPEGVYSEAGLALLQQMGYQTIFWGAAYKDYDPDDQPDAQAALEDIISRTKAGDIVLLHPMKANAEILADYIDYWQGQGMTFETL